MTQQTSGLKLSQNASHARDKFIIRFDAHCAGGLFDQDAELRRAFARAKQNPAR
jgi:hypothetical protein